MCVQVCLSSWRRLQLHLVLEQLLTVTKRVILSLFLSIFFFKFCSLCDHQRPVMCLSCDCISQSGSFTLWPSELFCSRILAAKLTWPGGSQWSVYMISRTTPIHACTFAPVAVVRLSCSRCSASRTAWTWRASTATSPPPTSPCHTLTTSASCGTSASREATGSDSISATSAWNPRTTVNTTTSR